MREHRWFGEILSSNEDAGDIDIACLNPFPAEVLFVVPPTIDPATSLRP